MQPRSDLCPLLEMVFQVTNRGRDSPRALEPRDRSDEKDEDFEELGGAVDEVEDFVVDRLEEDGDAGV